MKHTDAAVALATLALPAAYAQGTAAVVNMCDFPAYIWSVSNSQAPMVALPNTTVGYQEDYRSQPDGAGISLKLATSYLGDGEIDMSKNVTQFEYTNVPGVGMVWYDISHVNGNAFQGYPVLLQPSDLSCPNVTCASDDSVCKEMYNNPNDNAATHACASNADLFFLLCPPNNDASTTPDAGTSGSAATTTTTTGSNGLQDVVVSADGGVELAQPTASPAGQPANKVVTAPALSNLTSINAFNNMVEHWYSYSGPLGPATKRSEDDSARHSHKEFHERRRRNRMARGSE
ncbi:MAG: hypothetical protein LQ340_007788 [Diploschistes diacapsis]|nr:MAG: hypothetical protein LQ340_007788 [Diploschistes diacapsis]